MISPKTIVTPFYVLIIHTLHSSFIYFNTVFFIYKSQQYHPSFCIPTIIYYCVTFISPNISKYQGIILLFVTAFILKIGAYFIDSFIERPASTCLIFMLINTLVALIDRFLRCIEIKERHRGIYVLINEAPNYIFAVLFSMIEKIVGNRMWPYMLIVSIIYTTCGILLCNIDVKIRYDEERIDTRDSNCRTSIQDKLDSDIESDYSLETNSLIIEKHKTHLTCINYLDSGISTNLNYFNHCDFESDEYNDNQNKPHKYTNTTRKIYKAFIQKILQPLLNNSKRLQDFVILKKHHQAFTLFIIKILCTITDIVLYFFLVTKMPEQNFLIMYFSFDFLFKAIDISLPDIFFYYFVAVKILLLIITALSAVLFFYGHYIFLLLVFVINGLTNQIVYKRFDRFFERRVKNCGDLLVFTTVLWNVMWYAKHRKGNFEDFMFFSSVRL